MIEENHEECQDKHVLNTTSPERNYVDDFEFDELGPPNPGTILTPTPTPTPEKEPNDFNPTYIREEPTSESMFDLPESAMYNSRDPGEWIRFPELLLDELPVENIAKVPYNINGNHNYKIHAPDKNWLKAQDDGRWFFMRSSTMRNTNKVHKIGKCLGSYVCRMTSVQSLRLAREETHMLLHVLVLICKSAKHVAMWLIETFVVH